MKFPVPSQNVFELAREISADFRNEMAPLADDIDERIAAALGVPVAPFTTSMDAAFALKDVIFEGTEYVNVDFREYCTDGVMSFLCDIKTENSDSGGGQGNTRPRALTCGLIWHVQSLVDRQNER